MLKQARFYGIVGSIVIILWSALLIIPTYLNMEELRRTWQGPGMFGPSTPIFGGFVLLGIGIIGLIAGLVTLKAPSLAFWLQVYVCMILVFVLAVTVTSLWIIPNLLSLFITGRSGYLNYRR